MKRLYWKQSWQLLKQEKLFGAIYIVGTGLAITMVMVLAIVYYVKVGNIYPENNRDRTMVINYLKEENKTTQHTYHSAISLKAVQDYFYTLKVPEAVTAVRGEREKMVELPDKGLIEVKNRGVDVAYWKVFTFSFLQGKPFTEEDFLSGTSQAVISESLAKKVFGSVDVVGKFFLMDFNEYNVCGVVKDPSYSTTLTYAQVWIPYTSIDDYQRGDSGWQIFGPYSVYLLLKKSEDAKKASDEVNEIIHRLNNSSEDRVIDLMGQPELYQKYVFRATSDKEPVWEEIIRNVILVLLFLLLVPAINLSGMVSSRMEKRMSELGIRKAFGASAKTLLSQLLWENLFLTLMGGILGLFLSWGVIFVSKNWVLDIFEDWSEALPEGINVAILPDMLINPTIFMITFCVCLILNLLSAILPAWRALRSNIVDSLYIKN